MMRRPALFDELDASLAALVPKDAVEYLGNWLPSTRRTYETARQSGTGAGPFVDVVDLRWRGTLSCSAPIAGIAFLVTAGDVFWVKSAPAALRQPVDVSLHAYANYSANQATFVAGMGGSVLPGVPVACGVDLARTCTLASPRLMTARVEQLAHTDDAAFHVLLMPGRLLKVGRHHLWRVRDALALALSPRARDILTRGRSGTIRRSPVPRPVG